MEELISRPFVGQIQFQLVLLKRIETESAVGCLVFSLALTFFVSQKFAALKAGQLRLRMFGAGAKLLKGLKGPEGSPQPSHSLVLTSISHLSNHICKE